MHCCAVEFKSTLTRNSLRLFYYSTSGSLLHEKHGCTYFRNKSVMTSQSCIAPLIPHPGVPITRNTSELMLVNQSQTLAYTNFSVASICANFSHKHDHHYWLKVFEFIHQLFSFPVVLFCAVPFVKLSIHSEYKVLYSVFPLSQPVVILYLLILHRYFVSIFTSVFKAQLSKPQTYMPKEQEFLMSTVSSSFIYYSSI